MSKKEKGEFGYLKYKRSFNLLLTIIAVSYTHLTLPTTPYV